MSEHNQPVDQLIVVVHGVGDPDPGDPVGAFARSVALESKPLKESRSVLWLNEKADNSSYIQTFPVHVRDLKMRRKNVKLAEVFWGDLSRVVSGVPGMILGLFQILFGLRYVAYIAADQPGASAGWLKKLGLISSRVLHGPVLAVTLYLTTLAFAISGTQLLWPNSWQGPAWSRIVVAGCSVFGLIVALSARRLTRNRVIERTCFWLAVTSVFMFALMSVKYFWLDDQLPAGHASVSRPGLIWYCRVMVVLLGWLWFCEILVMLTMAGCWMLAVMRPGANHRALHIALLLPLLSIGIWGQAIPMLWLTTRASAKRFLRLDDFAQVFNEAVPLLGVQFIMCLAIVIATGVVAVRFLHWRSKQTVERFLAGARGPRLIVHGGLQLVLAACAAIGVSLVLTIEMLQTLGHSHQDFWIGRMMAESNKYAMAILVPVGFLLAFAFPRLHPVFDIVLDIVNHFYFRPTHVQDALDDDDEFDINETTFEAGNLFFSRRQAIHARMQRILTHYRDNMTERPELIIIAHSQGTQIAIEVLNDPELAWLNNQFCRVKLVTMGAPFSNLYQHYFSHIYPPLDAAYWSSLRRRVDRWANIFRIDDPVGTEIDFGPLLGMQSQSSASRPTEATESSQNPNESESADVWLEKTSPFNHRRKNQTCHTSDGACSEAQAPIVVSNHPVGCRGHVNYWIDREVLDIIHDVVLEPENQQATGKAA